MQRRFLLFIVMAGCACARVATATGTGCLLRFYEQHHRHLAALCGRSLAGWRGHLGREWEKVLSQGAVGFADVAAGKPMQSDALFWIASQSKPMTATALMILVDEGKVSLDDPVTKYLPEFNDQWLAVERDSDHVLLKRPNRRMTVTPHPQPHKRNGVRVGNGTTNARPAGTT